jgi:hypothetical protein
VSANDPKRAKLTKEDLDQVRRLWALPPERTDEKVRDAVRDERMYGDSIPRREIPDEEITDLIERLKRQPQERESK